MQIPILLSLPSLKSLQSTTNVWSIPVLCYPIGADVARLPGI